MFAAPAQRYSDILSWITNYSRNDNSQNWSNQSSSPATSFWAYFYHSCPKPGSWGIIQVQALNFQDFRSWGKMVPNYFYFLLCNTSNIQTPFSFSYIMLYLQWCNFLFFFFLLWEIHSCQPLNSFESWYFKNIVFIHCLDYSSLCSSVLLMNHVKNNLLAPNFTALHALF